MLTMLTAGATQGVFILVNPLFLGTTANEPRPLEPRPKIPLATAFKTRQSLKRTTDTHENQKQHHGVRLLDRPIIHQAPSELQQAPTEPHRHGNVGGGARAATLLLRRARYQLRRARYRDRFGGLLQRANAKTRWVRGACVGCADRLGQSRGPGNCARFTESCDAPPHERTRLPKRILALQLTTVTRGSDAPQIARQDQDPSSHAAVSLHQFEFIEYITKLKEGTQRGRSEGAAFETGGCGARSWSTPRDRRARSVRGGRSGGARPCVNLGLQQAGRKWRLRHGVELPRGVAARPSTLVAARPATSGA